MKKYLAIVKIRFDTESEPFNLLEKELRELFIGEIEIQSVKEVKA